MRHSTVRRFASVVAGALLLVTAGCSSGQGSRPPFPSDPDPCAAYCLHWVPPVYREVPKFVPGCGKTITKNVPVERVEFCTVCKPGQCKTVCVPDQCRRYGSVEVEPARDEWVKVNCPDPCTCCSEDCWKVVRVPPKYKWCEKCEIEKGFAYCYTPPPEYDVVAHTVRTCESVPQYCPSPGSVVMVSELFSPGHWEWQKRYDCHDCKTCPPKPDCAPMGAPCGCEPALYDPPATVPVRGDFRRSPAE